MPELRQAREGGKSPPFDDRWSNALAALWAKQSRWSQTANRLKAVHRSWTGPLIVAGFVGVILSTISPELARWLGSAQGSPAPHGGLLFVLTIAGPLLVTCSAVLTRELLGPKSEQAWIKARGISEDLKAEGYIYAAGAPPYGEKDTAPQSLATRIAALTEKADDIGLLDDGDPDIETKHPHQPLSTEEYIERRMSRQIDYYVTDARRNGDRLRLWRGVGVALAVVSAALGVIAGVQKAISINVWVAVISTAMATVTAFVYISRFEFLAASYFATSECLRDVINYWRSAEGSRRRPKCTLGAR
jgi:hypothetical protein